MDSLRHQGSLVCSHFLIHSFKVQFLQVYTGKVLDEEALQKLEAFVIPAEEHGIVLFSLLEGLDRLDSNYLHPFLYSLDFLVLPEG